mgnify:CR=1 FL=1
MSNPVDVAAQAVGGISKLAAALNESVATVSNWRARGIPVPRCAEVERVSGGTVTRRQMRPNDWQQIWPELASASGLAISGSHRPQVEPNAA